MWLLIVTYWSYAVPIDSRDLSFAPMLITQQFKTKKGCDEAKSIIKASFNHVSQVNSALSENFTAGTGPNARIVFSAECLKEK
jgi:hypothetical protein